MISSIRGPELPPAAAPTILAALEAAASSRAPWLTFYRGARGQELSFAEAWRLARGWCAALQAAGVRPGQRVAVIQPNSADFVGAFFGAQLAGATPVPLASPVVAAAGERNHLLLAAQVAH